MFTAAGTVRPATLGLRQAAGSPAQSKSETAISGTVRDARDAAIVGARVALAPAPEGSAPTATTVTDATGAFRFERVPLATYRLSVSADGFVSKDETLELDGDASREFSVRLAPAGAQESVTVTDDPTQPYAGGQVARGGRVGLLGDQDLFDTPFNITSYTAQTIKDTQAVNVGDVVKRDPSVHVASGGTTFYEDFQIRGFRVTGSSVLFDGLSSTVAPYGQNLLYATERVDIVKGANSFLSGVSGGLNVGGTINVVPKRAPDQTLLEFEPIYESDSRLGGHLDFGHRFGEEKRFGVRLNVFGKTGHTPVDGERERLSEVALALDYRFDRARVFADIGFRGQYTRGTSTGLFGDAGTQIPEPPPAAGNNFAQPFTFSNVESGYGLVRGEFDLTRDVTVYGAFGGNLAKYKQFLSSAFLKNGEGDIDELFQNGTGKDFGRSWQVGLRASFSTGPVGHRVAVDAARVYNEYRGYYVFDEEHGGQPVLASNIYDPVRVAPRPDLFFLPDGAEQPPYYRSIEPSVAVADVMSLFKDRLFVTAGARLQTLKDFYPYVENGPFEPGYDETALTPSFAGLVKVTQRVSVYGNYIESLQQGLTAPDEAVNRGEVFPPSRNRQVEGGVKVDFGRLGVTGDVYKFDQPIGLLDPVTRIFSGAGRQRNRGAELNVFGQLGRSVRLNGGVAFTDAVLAKTQDGIFDGNRAPGVARVNATLFGDWDTPFLGGLALSGGVIRTGSTFVDFQNTGVIDGYTAVDLNARYTTNIDDHPVTIRATVENPFNRSYWISDVYGGFFLSAPRTIRLSATFSF